MKSIAAFFISPFLSVPIVLLDIYNKRKSGLIVFSLLMGIISYLYVPTITNDKATYFEVYDLFKTYSWEEFWLYIALTQPDFTYYLLLYAASQMGIGLQFVFLIVTFISIYITTLFPFKLIESFRFSGSSKESICFFALFVLSISLPSLLSGIRFYWGAVIVCLGIYTHLFENKHLKGFLLIILSITIHFSLAAFLIIPFLSILFKKKLFYITKILFIFSLFFLFVPRSFLSELFSTGLSFSEVYTEKAESYLGDNDYLNNNLAKGNIINLVKFFINNSWVVLAYIYAIAYWFDRQSMPRYFFLMSFAISNFCFSAPTIYDRYVIITKIAFLLLLIYDYYCYKRKITPIAIGPLLFGSFLTDIVVIWPNLFISLIHPYIFTLITIFLKGDMSANDFIE